MEGITVVLGNHKATRIVDQLQHSYTRVLLDPNVSEVFAAQRQLRDRVYSKTWREHQHPFYNLTEPPLLIFTKPLDKTQRRRLALNSRHNRVHALFLAETAWPPAERANVDNLLLFPEDGALPAFDRWVFALPHVPVEDGECVWVGLRDGGAPRVQVFRPWSRHWTPETHWSFDRATRARVKQLLLGQRDAGSPLHRLDRNCMLCLLRWAV